ncbi:hypothetical protein AB0J83_23425 [Actinoplanes sp. NPDC049596]|uniref:hypothetical protein n=1 Tax=unclassified Actinoplanes TaxID=2626549 RepID=UPI00343440C6
MPDESTPEVYHELSGHDVVDGIEAQLSTGNFVLPPVALPAGDHRHFPTTMQFWQSLLSEEARASHTVTLENVLLSEWFPRSPGLFHTEEAERWREYAAPHLLRLTTEQQAAYDATLPPNPTVFDLHGKIEMLRGGIGCVRLNRKLTSEGHLWFMSASTNRSADEGVPLALTDEIYAQHIDYLSEHGVLPCSLTGKLVVMPDFLLTLYHGSISVPRVYLHVEEIRPNRGPTILQDGPPVVNVAVMFESPSSYLPVSASYIEFVPGRRGTMRKRLPWLEYYVEKLHAGVIITDFDEQMSHFSDAIFSLQKISHQSLQEPQLKRLSRQLEEAYYPEYPFVRLIERQRELSIIIQNYSKDGVIVGDHITAGANAIIVNRSTLENALNTVQSSPGTEIAAALRELAGVVERSGDPRARDNFNALTEELAKPERNDNRVKVWLDAVVAALPGIAQATTAAATISQAIAQ